MNRVERFSSAERVIKIGLLVNTFLMILKLTVGYLAHSEAVFADGMESVADFIAMTTTLIAVRIGRKPLDGSHPYGHGRAESIAAILVALVIFSCGMAILVRSVVTLSSGTYQEPGFAALVVAAATISIKEWLYRSSHRVGQQLESPALLALASDHRKDALTSLGTLLGVTAAFFGFAIMDPLVAGLTSLAIFRIGYVTFRSATHDLMDGCPDDKLVADVLRLTEEIKGVEHVHDIRARRSGQYILIDLKLDMDPAMTVKQSHAVCSSVKRKIFSQFGNVGDVMIHVNPHDEQHSDLTRL